jgi:hypothetical protein
MLDLRSFVVNIFPEDGTLLPKIVGVDTYSYYEAYFLIFFVVLYLVHFAG